MHAIGLPALLSDAAARSPEEALVHAVAEVGAHVCMGVGWCCGLLRGRQRGRWCTRWQRCVRGRAGMGMCMRAWGLMGGGGAGWGGAVPPPAAWPSRHSLLLLTFPPPPPHAPTPTPQARRAAPAVLYLPHLPAWWDTAPSSLRATLWMLLADLPPDLPLLLLATAERGGGAGGLDPEARALFGGGGAQALFQLAPPPENARARFFRPVAGGCRWGG